MGSQIAHKSPARLPERPSMDGESAQRAPGTSGAARLAHAHDTYGQAHLLARASSAASSGGSSDASRTETRRLRRLRSPSRKSIRDRQREAGVRAYTYA